MEHSPKADNPREQNRARVLQLLLAQPELCRVEIAERLGLSKSTVSVVIEELLGRGLVTRSGIGAASSAGGPRPELLQINSAARVAYGVEIDDQLCRGVVVDLSGRPLCRSVAFVGGHEVDDVVATVVKLVLDLTEGAPDGVPLGCGIAIAGLVNSAEGIIGYSTHYSWRDVPLRDIVADRFSFPVYVADRPKAAVLGEKRCGIGQGIDDLVYIHLGTGIGAGIVIGGELLTGVGHTAGEIGHVTIIPDGQLCKCGNQGCLETIASGPAIIQRAIALAKAGCPTILSGWMEGDLERVSLELIDRAVREGDELATTVVQETGAVIGIAIAGLLNLLNPRMVVVGGPVARFGTVLLTSIRDAVRRRALSLPASTADIVLSELGDDAESIGAAALVLQEGTKLSSLKGL